MTKEEKKAIIDCDSIFICLDDAMSEDSANDYRKSYKILRNLIEKQSKEIEELSDKLTEKICKGVEEEILEEYRQIIISKDKEIEELKDEYNTKLLSNAGIYLLGFKDGKNSVKDNIKAKIEPRLKELDEKMKKEWKEYGNSREYQDMEDEWNFLQSLLEKE